MEKEREYEEKNPPRETLANQVLRGLLSEAFVPQTTSSPRGVEYIEYLKVDTKKIRVPSSQLGVHNHKTVCTRLPGSLR